MLQMAFHERSVTYDTAIDALNTLFPEEGFPFPEEGIGLECYGGIPRADGRVSSAHDVNIAVQGSVGLDNSGIADARAEAEIRSQGMERHTGGDQLAVGGRHEADAGIVGGQHLAGSIAGVDAPGGTLERLLADLCIDELLGRYLGQKGR